MPPANIDGDLDATARLRALPGVDALAREVLAASPELGHAIAVEAARSALEAAREAIRGGSPGHTTDLVETAIASAEQLALPSLRRVINASGVILQTNLGRAPLSDRALAAVAEAGTGYTNLEYELEAGRRGSRHDHVRSQLRRATGAEDGIALNNNASALFMVLSVFAAGREVVVSRGEAVEIGGGFRIPDVLRQSGATLVEVGTTNRTYARDYATATTGETAAYLRIHASNFTVVGFTARPDAKELADVARQHDVLLIDDLGSGCLLETEALGMAHEPTVQESLAAGADLTLFSGDKLLGGPQCGIVVGRTALIEQLRRHPLARALRVDKLTIAALNATLQAYIDGRAAEEIPVWRMASAPLDAVHERAARWAALAGAGGTVVESRSMVGGGSLPGEGVPTWCAAIGGPGAVNGIAERLRRGTPAVVARIENDRVLLDPRTVDPAADGDVAAAIRAALKG